MGMFHLEFLTDSELYSCRQCGTHITCPRLVISKVPMLTSLLLLTMLAALPRGFRPRVLV